MKRAILVFFTALLCLKAFAGNPPAVQWHFDGNRTVGGNYEDWVFSIIPTEDKGYIACGYTTLIPPGATDRTYVPVIFKLDNLGSLKWLKVVTGATGSGGGIASPGTWTGILFQMIKTSNGYAAGGYLLDGNTGKTRILIAEVDNDGNYLNPGNMVYKIGNATACAARTIAMSPDGSEYIVAGDASFPGSSSNFLSIAKINYTTHAITAATTAGGDFLHHGKNNAYKILIKPTIGSAYDIYTCGFYSASDKDGTQITGLPNAPTYFMGTVSTTETLTLLDKDIWLLRLDNNLANPISSTYPKSGLSPIPANTPVGPASARGFTNTGGVIKIAGSELAGVLAEDYDPSTPDIQNYFEKATDMILDKDGNIVLVAMVNCLMDYDYFDGNGKNLIQTTNGFNVEGRQQGFWGPSHDPANPLDLYYYDEYTDADVYIINIDPATCSKNWDKFIAHMSSKDFYPRVIQDGRGNYIISGSTADYYTPANAPDLNQVDYYDAFVISTPNTSASAHNWRRNLRAHNEDAMCVFALAPTADGGFIIGVTMEVRTNKTMMTSALQNLRLTVPQMSTMICIGVTFRFSALLPGLIKIGQLRGR